MRKSKDGVDLIKHFEGCKLEAYQCSGDVWTIGHGHTKGVEEGQKITKKIAAAFLQEDIEMVETHVTRLVTVELEQHQWDALISWCFNLGCGNLRSSTMLQVINRGEIDQVTSELIRWDKSNGKALAGLTRRRKSEATLFDKGELDYGKVKDNG